MTQTKTKIRGPKPRPSSQDSTNNVQLNNINHLVHNKKTAENIAPVALLIYYVLLCVFLWRFFIIFNF